MRKYRLTYTYAEMLVSRSTYDEINLALIKAGYEHAFMEDGALNMRGIALTCDEPPETDKPFIGIANQPYVGVIHAFAGEMIEKMDRKRINDGFHGWDDPVLCSTAHLRNLLKEAMQKGDPVDVANFAMMLHARGERTA